MYVYMHVICCVWCFCVQFEEWELHYGLLGGYIKTQTTPRIFYLPKSHNKKTTEQLDATKLEIQGTYVRTYYIVMPSRLCLLTKICYCCSAYLLPSCEMHRHCNISYNYIVSNFDQHIFTG